MDGKDATELHELLDRVQLGIHEQGVRKPVLQDSLEREFWERHLRFCSDTDGVNDGEKLKTRHWIHDISALHRGAAHSFSDWLNHQHTDVCNPIGEVPKRLASVRGHGLLGVSAHVLTSCFGMYRIKQASEPGSLFPSWLPYTTSDTLQQLFLPPSKETATEARSEGGCLFQIAFSAKNATLAAHATRLDASFLPSMTLQRFRSDPTASFLHPFFNDPNASVDVRGSATDVIPLTLPHLYIFGLISSQNAMNNGVIKCFGIGQDYLANYQRRYAKLYLKHLEYFLSEDRQYSRFFIAAVSELWMNRNSVSVGRFQVPRALHFVTIGKPIPSVASDIALAHRALYRFLLTSFINIPQDSHDLLSQLASLWFGSLTPFACKAYIDGSEALLDEKVDKPEIELKPVATSKWADVSAESFRAIDVSLVENFVFYFPLLGAFLLALRRLRFSGGDDNEAPWDSLPKILDLWAARDGFSVKLRTDRFKSAFNDEIMDDNTSKSRPACDERCRQPHAESVEGFRWAGASLQYSGHFSPSISPPYARLARPADPYLQGVAAEICAKLVDGSRASASLINVFGVEKSEIDAERRRIASQSDAFCAAPSLSSSFAVRAADEHAALQRAIDALGAWERPAGAWEMDAALPLLHALSQRANAFVVRARRRLVALAGPAAVAQVAAVESAVAPAAQSADQGASAATSASLAAVPTSVQRAIGCALARWPASAQPVNLRPLASIVNWVALIVVIAAVLFVSR